MQPIVSAQSFPDGPVAQQSMARLKLHLRNNTKMYEISTFTAGVASFLHHLGTKLQQLQQASIRFTWTHCLITDVESHLILWQRRARPRKRKRLFSQLIPLDELLTCHTQHHYISKIVSNTSKQEYTITFTCKTNYKMCHNSIHITTVFPLTSL